MSGPLDRFIPEPDVRERHEIVVRAPASEVFAAAEAFDFQSVPLVSGIIRLRELFLGSKRVERQPRPFLQEIAAMGWGTLASETGRLFVGGARCQPWLAKGEAAVPALLALGTLRHRRDPVVHAARDPRAGRACGPDCMMWV